MSLRRALVGALRDLNEVGVRYAVSGASDPHVERIAPADEATRARVRALAETPLGIDEWRARLAIPLTDEEHENTMELVRWFTRRYPTAAARLAYVRRAYRRWLGGQRSGFDAP